MSIGFTIDSSPVVGVILNPFTSHLYTGIRGHGSWRTTLDLPLVEVVKRDKLPLYRKPLKLNASLIGYCTGVKNEGLKFDMALAKIRGMLAADGGAVHGIRTAGSTALDICDTACGYLDAKISTSYAWDVCAAWVILTEAGGYVLSGTQPKTENGTLVEERDLFVKNFLFIRATGTRTEMERFARDLSRVTDS